MSCQETASGVGELGKDLPDAAFGMKTTVSIRTADVDVRLFPSGVLVLADSPTLSLCCRTAPGN